MNLTVAITGASGAVLCREALRALEADERVARVHFVASENSLRVIAEELGVSGRVIVASGAGHLVPLLRSKYRRQGCEWRLSRRAQPRRTADSLNFQCQ